MWDEKNWLLPLEPAEKEYKKLYEANPYDQFTPVSSWSQFVKQYKKKMKNFIDIPLEAPSDIRDRFYEVDFFLPEIDVVQKNHSGIPLIYPPHMNAEIVVFKHLRYLPIMMHTVEFVKISYVLSGESEFHLNSKVYHLTEGDLIIVPPDIEQAFFVNCDDSIVINIIMRQSTFQDSFSPLLKEQNNISNFFVQMLYQKEFSQLIYFKMKDETISELVTKLYMESQEHILGSKIIMNSYILLLFGQLIRSHSQDVKELLGKKNTRKFSNIIQYIRDNRSNVSLKQLAEHFNLSEGYLSRYIKKETGYSFSGLLREMKMSQAAGLIRTTDLSVEEIVEIVGYVDISNFYRNFKKIYLMTPAEYREYES